tara:strand:+ start:2906 stop:3826 length:921 start_codon:yes stop_codon:yes gene_type:complete
MTAAVEIIKPKVRCNKFPALNRPVISLPLRQSVVQAAEKNPEIREYLETTPMIESDDKRVLIWADTQEVIDVVSAKFKVLHHADAVKAALDSIEKINGGEPDWSVNVHGPKGQSVNVTIDAPFVEGISVAEGTFIPHHGDARKVGDIDLSKILFKMVNSYGKISAYAHLMAKRLVCTNGMKVPMALGSYKHKHTSGLDLEQMAEAFQLMAKNSVKIGPVYNDWSREVWSPERVLSASKELSEMGMAQKYTRRVADMANIRRATKWDVHNLCTNMATHSTKSVSSQDTMDRIVERYFWDHNALALAA